MLLWESALSVSTGPSLILNPSRRTRPWESANLLLLRQTIETKPFGYFSFLIFSLCYMELCQNRRFPFHPKLCHFPEMYCSCVSGEHWGHSTQLRGLHPSWEMNSMFLCVARTKAGHCLGLRAPRSVDCCFLPWGEDVYLPASPRRLVQKYTFPGEIIRHPQGHACAMEPKPSCRSSFRGISPHHHQGEAVQCTCPLYESEVLVEEVGWALEGGFSPEYPWKPIHFTQYRQCDWGLWALQESTKWIKNK